MCASMKAAGRVKSPSFRVPCVCCWLLALSVREAALERLARLFSLLFALVKGEGGCALAGA